MVGKESVTEILSSKAVRNHVLMITQIAQSKEVRYVGFLKIKGRFRSLSLSVASVFNHLKFGGLFLFVERDFNLSTVFGRE